MEIAWPGPAGAGAGLPEVSWVGKALRIGATTQRGPVRSRRGFPQCAGDGGFLRGGRIIGGNRNHAPVMQLRLKFVLLAIVPLLVAIAAVAAVVRLEARALAEAEVAVVEPVLLSARKAELTHYVDLALGSIDYLVQRGDAASQEEALRVLHGLDYGSDGYFFVYDLNGRSLMHPRQPELVGQDLWNLRDPQGVPTIQRLIARAKAGGGFEEFLWQRPSTQRLARKLGYVTIIPRWGWMIGTGLYLDDIDEARERIDREATRAIRTTMGVIVAIAVVATVLVALAGLALNVSDRRDAEQKMRALARKVVRSQEMERARVARELHDGVSQSLVSVKFLLEAAQVRNELEPAAQAAIERGLDGVNGVIRDVRRISHGLRPTLLDNLGLVAAISQVLEEFGQRSGIAVHLDADPATALPEAVGTALFRVVQEALNNIQRHAAASEVEVALQRDAGGLTLTVRDNGRGFDVEQVAAAARGGLGLSSMRERVETLGGSFEIESTPAGTRLRAYLPASALRA